MKPKRFLCICEGGLVRSHALVWILKTQHGQDAIACGWRWNDNETLEHLCGWADYIILMQQEFAAKIPDKVALEMPHKIRVVDVGPDRYGNHLNEELQEFLRGVAKGWSERSFAI